MFNKSILAAALLTVGTIAGGSAVSAAEIGVRNTTGVTNRHVSRGVSEFVRVTRGTYSDQSAGTSRTGNFFGPNFSASGYVRSETGTIRERDTESYRFSGNSRNTFSELSTFSR